MLDTFKLWLEPRRWLDDLAWVYRKGFFSFVFLWGVLQVGFFADGLFATWLAFASDGAIPLRNLRIGMLIWPVSVGIGATVIWLIAYWHFKVRKGDSESTAVRT